VQVHDYKRRIRARAALLPVLALGICLAAGTAVACGDEDDDPTRTIDVSVQEYAIDVDRPTLPAGSVEFKVTHLGEERHELAILRTDLAADDLPTTPDDTVDLEADGIDVVGTFDEVEPGDVVTMTFDLDAADYVIICNVPTHYEQGMRVAVQTE
jgi:hypothetical protein